MTPLRRRVSARERIVFRGASKVPCARPQRLSIRWTRSPTLLFSVTGPVRASGRRHLPCMQVTGGNRPRGMVECHRPCACRPSLINKGDGAMVRAIVCLLAISAAALTRPTPALAVDDVTVLHVSDQHVPHAFSQTQATVDALPYGEPMALEPYGVTVPAPSAVISTGDLNEFGGGKGWWAQYMSLWAACPVPVYHQLGNHDNTWRCGRPALRRIHGSAFYAFEQAGV
ncbi:MAG: hypothetical protein GF393_03425, partial [Armatimonadia bacterium]|nr:hypothetical protein [Armatimonadia bacterium]